MNGADVEMATLDRLRDAATAILLAALRSAAPRRSGRLRRSVTAAPTGGGATFLAPGYARWVVGGTKSHVIRPRTRRALAWPGGAHPVAAVRHPGTTANDFRREAIRQATPALLAALAAAGRELVRERETG